MAEISFFQGYKKLELLRPLFKRAVPGFVFNFLIRCMDALSSLLGFSFGVRVPDDKARYNEELWEPLSILDILVKEKVITNAHMVERLYHDEPAIPYIWNTQLSEHRLEFGFGGYGYDLLSQKDALWRAIGEAVERWALSMYHPSLGSGLPYSRQASYADLKKEGALDIFSVAGYGNDQRKKGHSHYQLQFDEASIFHWVRGRSLAKKKDIWIPLQLVTFAHENFLREGKEPLILQLVSTGAAVHNTRAEAILSGILEIFQRDAFMIYWTNAFSPKRLDLLSFQDKRIERIRNLCARYRLELHALYLKTDMPVHTVLAVILDRTGVGPAVCVGASSDFDINEAVYKSLLEAIACRTSVRAEMDRAITEDPNLFKNLNPHNLGHVERLLYWCAPERLRDISFMVKGDLAKKEELPYVRNNFPAVSDALSYLVGSLAAKGYEVVTTDILRKDIMEKTGLFAYMTTIPGFQPLHLREELPCFSGKRLFEVPRLLGLVPRHTPNPVPHPFP